MMLKRSGGTRIEMVVKFCGGEKYLVVTYHGEIDFNISGWF